MPKDSVKRIFEECYYYKRQVGYETMKHPEFFNGKIRRYSEKVMTLNAKKAKSAPLCFHNRFKFDLQLFIKEPKHKNIFKVQENSLIFVRM